MVNPPVQTTGKSPQNRELPPRRRGKYRLGQQTLASGFPLLITHPIRPYSWTSCLARQVNTSASAFFLFKSIPLSLIYSR